MLNKEKPVKVIIDKNKCTKCGLCIKFCADYLKKDVDGFPTSKHKDETLMGCIQCGRCMIKCPNEAIEIIGDDIDKNHIKILSDNVPDYDMLNSLLLSRRSIRKFKNEDISKDDINKILASAATAPVGIPPSDVKVLVINGRKKVQTLVEDLIIEFKKMKKFLTPLSLYFMKFSMSKTEYKVLTDFVIPLCNTTIDSFDNGIDSLLYNAPAVIIFYGNELATAEDMIIAATTGTIAAQSLNLGTCFIGSVSYMFNNSSRLQQKYGLKKGDKVSIAFILGKPDENYPKSFQRNFKNIKLID